MSDRKTTSGDAGSAGVTLTIEETFQRLGFGQDADRRTLLKQLQIEQVDAKATPKLPVTGTSEPAPGGGVTCG